ncbi:MAG: hypothetical protein P1U35_12190, partial [Cycloclasticus sp.]|nr:hypothetical protein [Cycloclasticus sp.]
LTGKITPKQVVLISGTTSTGRDLNIPALFSYGTKRITQVASFIKANKQNLKFIKAFEGSIATNKKNAIALEKKLRRAIESNNETEFNAVMEYSMSCDKSLNIKNNGALRLSQAKSRH